MTPRQPAVFLDRDGTINVERSFVTSPDQMELLPGAALAIRRFQAAGFACVVVTNQSAVGRGMMTQDDLDRVNAEMGRQLAIDGVTLEGIYACTFAPTPDAQDHPDRKPAPGMLLRAAAELHLDLPRSWMIGDTLRDMLAGQSAGCRGCILVRTGHPVNEADFDGFLIVDNLHCAANHVLARLAS
jgi:D-glycero-D-manno-heptose 1,7-bisphosphate phosphatase